MLLREVEIALEAYKEKFGAYPECANPDRGAEVLFDRLMAGSAPDGSDRFLMPSPDRLRKEPGPDGEIRMSLVDPFGHPIRYRTGALPGEGVGPHPDYSLWSTGGKPDNPPAKWITL